MLTITDGGSLTRALTTTINDEIRELLMLRRDQLGGDIKDQARFIVVQPGDGLDTLENELGFSGLSNPDGSFGCEWVADHGAFYEAVWILTDDGYARVALVPKQAGIDPKVLQLCAEFATEKA